MQIKKILIQFEFDPEKTRWLCRGEELADFLASISRSVVICHTTGQIPAIMVIEEEKLVTATQHASSN